MSENYVPQGVLQEVGSELLIDDTVAGGDSPKALFRDLVSRMVLIVAVQVG